MKVKYCHMPCTNKNTQHISIIWTFSMVECSFLYEVVLGSNFVISLKFDIWHLLGVRSSLIFRKIMQSGYTLKLVRGMIMTYSQIHHTDKY